MKNNSPEMKHYDTYFPLLIFLVKTRTTMVVQSPDEIPNGVAFRVWGTRYNPSTNKPLTFNG